MFVAIACGTLGAVQEQRRIKRYFSPAMRGTHGEKTSPFECFLDVSGAAGGGATKAKLQKDLRFKEW